MTDIVCPLCGRLNPPDLEECQYCQAPLKTGGFIAPAGEGEKKLVSPFSEDKSSLEGKAADSKTSSSLEQSIPDWLKETEAGFIEGSETVPEEPGAKQLSKEVKPPSKPQPATPKTTSNAIDDDWLASLLVEAGAVEAHQPKTQVGVPEQQEPEPSYEEPVSEIMGEKEEEPAIPTPPAEKPDWLASLEATSDMKLDGGIFGDEGEQNLPEPAEIPEEMTRESIETPEWLTKAVREAPAENLKEAEEPAESPLEPEATEESPRGAEAPIAPGEIPGWLEALRPAEVISPTGPVEDVSRSEVVSAGPLMGLQGVISAQPSAIRPQKPPTYSIKLKVTDEQQDRLRMMQELLADEEKPKPLPSKPIITSRHIFRLIVAIVLLLPMIWMIVGSKQQAPVPQPANVPGVVDFNQQVQAIPANAPVLIAFDYEAGFSGELNIATTNAISQLMKKGAYLTLVSTSPSGPALAESVIRNANSTLLGADVPYSYYADLGFIPGGTMGLRGLASSPKSILPYTLDNRNVWVEVPLDQITTITDFSAVFVISSDPDTARLWIEQVGPELQEAGKPLLIITSSQAEPLIRPYYQATPSQVKGLIAGLTGGVAYASAVGNYPQNGVWDAYSAGITVSILIILIGSIIGVILKMLSTSKKNEA